jgi:single-strand DNA-binding protein
MNEAPPVPETPPRPTKVGVEVIADTVQFIGPREGGSGGSGGGGGGEWSAPAAAPAPAADIPDAWSGGAAAQDDDIPF